MKRATKENAKIESTFLGREDHGIPTFFLHLDYGGSGQGFGGRVGVTCDNLMQVLETLSASSWEKLPGVLLRTIWTYDRVVAIGHITKDVWLMPTNDGNWAMGTYASLPLDDYEVESR